MKAPNEAVKKTGYTRRAVVQAGVYERYNEGDEDRFGDGASDGTNLRKGSEADGGC